MSASVWTLVVALIGLRPSLASAGALADGALRRLGALAGERQAKDRRGSVIRASYRLGSGCATYRQEDQDAPASDPLAPRRVKLGRG